MSIFFILNFIVDFVLFIVSTVSFHLFNFIYFFAVIFVNKSFEIHTFKCRHSFIKTVPLHIATTNLSIAAYFSH